MVILAASVLTRSGKVLLSRQYVDISRQRIESLLQAFPILVGSGLQQTYVETDEVRFLYQPMEALCMLLVTNKESNIIQDLETLRLVSKLMSKVVFKIIFALDEVITIGGNKDNSTLRKVKQCMKMYSLEERVQKHEREAKIHETKDLMKRRVIEIACDKIERQRRELEADRTHTLTKNVAYHPMGDAFGNSIILPDFLANPKKFTPPSSSLKGCFARTGHISNVGPDPTPAEEVNILKTPPKNFGMKIRKTDIAQQLMESLKAEDASMSLNETQLAAGLFKESSGLVSLTIEEKLVVRLNNDGGLNGVEVKGLLALTVTNKDDTCIQVQIESGNDPQFKFNTHPLLDVSVYLKDKILALKDADSTFPVGRRVPLLRWYMTSEVEDVLESVLPFTIHFFSQESAEGTCYASFEYQASETLDLQNVQITIPLPGLHDPPQVTWVDGDWRFNATKSLEWSILLIDKTNRKGCIEFVLPRADESFLHPVDVKFTAPKCLADMKVVSVNLRAGGEPIRFVCSSQLTAESYQLG